MFEAFKNVSVKEILEYYALISLILTPLFAIITFYLSRKTHLLDWLYRIADGKKNKTEELERELSEHILEHMLSLVRARNIKRINREASKLDSIIRETTITEKTKALDDTLDFFRTNYYEWDSMKSLKDMLSRLKKLMAYEGTDAIKRYTIHRAKWLQNNRVFILDYDKLPSKAAQEWQIIQERNLQYVAVTRAKKELFICVNSSEKKQ